jgi:hypothetical protein
MWKPVCPEIKLDLAVSASIRQEYLSWGRTGVENDYQPLEGAFPQGPWQSVFAVAVSASAGGRAAAVGENVDERAAAEAALASVLITDVVVQTSPQPANPLTRLNDTHNAFVSTVTVHFQAAVASMQSVRVGGNWSAAASRRLSIPAGSSNATFMLRAHNVLLWWPNGLGLQRQYKIEVSVNNSEIRAERLVGFRSVVFVNRQFEQGGVTPIGYTGKPRLFYRVNGVELFVRGANFITTDMLESRATEARYR